MAGLLDYVCMAVFGAWAYLAAKGKGRDGLSWAIVAAFAFYVPGYAVQAWAFPALAPSAGWPPEWQKPSAFVVGGLCALLLDVYLTFLVPPLPPAGSDAQGDSKPPKAGGGDDGGRA